MNNSQSHNSKIIEIVLLVIGTIWFIDALYNQPSELFRFLGLTNQFIILVLSIVVLIISAALLNVHKEQSGVILFLVVIFFISGLQIIGKDSLSNIIGLILILLSMALYKISRSKQKI